MDCPTRGVMPGEIVLTSAVTNMSVCIVARDISRVKQMQDGTTKLTFKQNRNGTGNLYKEAAADVNARIAKALTE